jgi:hypothetical protein
MQFMSEDTEQFYAPFDPQIPERAESARTSEDEACLTVEILQYWDIHLHYLGSMKETNQKAREVRQHLGKLLFHLKQVIAKPGRDGRWPSFLKEHGIFPAPRRTVSSPGTNGRSTQTRIGSVRQLQSPQRSKPRRCLIPFGQGCAVCSSLLVLCLGNMFDKFDVVSCAASRQSRLSRLWGICGTAH